MPYTSTKLTVALTTEHGGGSIMLRGYLSPTETGKLVKLMETLMELNTE